MTDEVVDLRAWRRRNDPASISAAPEEIRRAAARTRRLARERRLRDLCGDVVEMLAASEHPLASDPVALLELMEVLELLRAEARFQAEHPVRG
ncbi:hypothetical protein LRS10_14275 [Phenylobacterium sp. J426]|uniref:hypothetical protein n=1 Tax=Phenylobacterium sp. J426 TaxID=2898439 RepID=UPI002150E17C|nr:hypothetical protein [Phenylobacterium sp. J426]MCR5875245.1 hypothetical protein [Phenylobacterium sp. J426]